MANSMTHTGAHSQAQPVEDLTFRPSTEGTLGVELELQVLDRESGDLVPGALRILDACAEEELDGVSGEFLQSMLEVKTGVCRSVAEVRDTLFPLLRRVRNLAGSLGYDLAWGGTHPLARACDSALFPDERYRRIHQRQGWLAYQEAVFGLHVHVGVPSEKEAIGLLNLLVEYLPHLIALSANSPFWQGVDTGFASGRLCMFRPSPYPPVPPHYVTWQDFCRDHALLHRAGVIESSKDLYWDIRPRSHLGTLELRVCDVPASPTCLLGLTALIRCLVLDGLALLREQPEESEQTAMRFRLAPHNRWQAARYGLRGRCVRDLDRGPVSLSEDLAEMLQRLQPLARAAGEADFLRAVQPDGFESGADRQRRLYRQSGSWQVVLDDLKTRWVRALDDAVPAARVSNGNGTAATTVALSGPRLPLSPRLNGHRSLMGSAAATLSANGHHG